MPRIQTRRKTRRRMRGGEWTLDEYKRHLQNNIHTFGTLASKLTTKRGIDSTQLAIMSTKNINFQTGYTCAYLKDIIAIMSTFLLNLPTSNSSPDRYKIPVDTNNKIIINRTLITFIRTITHLFFRENNIPLDSNLTQHLIYAQNNIPLNKCEHEDKSSPHYLKLAYTLSQLIVHLHQLQDCEEYKGGICPSPCIRKRILFGRNKCLTPASFTPNIRKTPQLQPGNPAISIPNEQYNPSAAISPSKRSPFLNLRRTAQAFGNVTRRIRDRFRKNAIEQSNEQKMQDEFLPPPSSALPPPPKYTSLKPAIVPRTLTRPEIVTKERTQEEMKKLINQLIIKWDDVIAYAAHLKSVRGITDQDLQNTSYNLQIMKEMTNNYTIPVLKFIITKLSWYIIHIASPTWTLINNTDDVNTIIDDLQRVLGTSRSIFEKNGLIMPDLLLQDLMKVYNLMIENKNEPPLDLYILLAITYANFILQLLPVNSCESFELNECPESCTIINNKCSANALPYTANTDNRTVKHNFNSRQFPSQELQEAFLRQHPRTFGGTRRKKRKTRYY